MDGAGRHLDGAGGGGGEVDGAGGGASGADREGLMAVGRGGGPEGSGDGYPEGGQAEGEPPRIRDVRAGLPCEHAEVGSASVGKPGGRPATWRAGSASTVRRTAEQAGDSAA